METFEFEQDYVLEDAVALLRPLQQADVEHLMHFATDEPDLWKYSVVPLVGEAGMISYLGEAMENRRQKKEYAFVIINKRTGEYAGCTRFYDISLKNKSMQLGYTWYGEKFQRTGLNRHCKLLLLQFAFEQVGMERVEFRADINNECSINAMKNLGCTVEGVLRSHLTKPDGTRRDSIILSILRSEWLSTAKAALIQKIQ